MPFVDETFVPTTAHDHAGGPLGRTRLPTRAILDRLHAELATTGVVVGEQPGAFGPDTAAALTEFQKLYRLPAEGTLDPTTGGVLALASLVATEDDRGRLRAKLTEARGAVPNAPRYDEWLARFAVTTGAYDVALGLRSRLRDLWDRDLSAILDWWRAIAPEVPFPENYYTYRYSLMAQVDIDDLRNGRTQGSSGGVIFMRPRPPGPAGPTDLPIIDPPPPIDPPPQPPVNPEGDSPQRLANAAEVWLAAVEAWQVGNAEFARRRYASAAAAYDTCQRAAIAYFAWNPLYHFSFSSPTMSQRVDELLWKLAAGRQNWPGLWRQVEWRRQLLSLTELLDLDWLDQSAGPPIRAGSAIYNSLQANLAGNEGPMDVHDRIVTIDFRALMLATVLAPLARGEANRLRRQYAAARSDFELVLRRRIPNPNASAPNAPQLTAALLCERIEVPFARLMLIETLLDQAEAQYKARTRIEDLPQDESQAALAKLLAIKADFEARQIPGDARPGALPLQHLIAALTYADVIATIAADGDYAQRSKQALDDLSTSVYSAPETASVTELQLRARAITLPTVQAKPTLSASGAHPHEALVEFVAPADTVLHESNPRVYGLLLQAQARLLQIWSGFNYLGYQDDYTPPWRFMFLLERARYFVEHAKNAQRDYLNFLSNAENEELKELSAAQNVELEKANVAIETARVDQVSREVGAARASKALANKTADDAQKRLDAYKSFDTWSGVLDIAETFESAGVAAAGAAMGNPAAIGDFIHTIFGAGKAELQRELEKNNLRLAVEEAKLSRNVAAAQLDVAKAALVVAGLQRQASLLRHAQALQTLQFMRNRSLNAEQWERLAAAIRDVADTYLRYAIELSFLAQQAYNFEADKRLDVIRFDYDVSDVGAMLAADFLLRDLDTLEQDHIVSQQARLQQMRYVVSLARDYPESLQTLAAEGRVIFSVRLEQLERHFPGVIGLRVTNVELQPLALMDPTRVTVELTHRGSGAVRLKRQPGGSPLDASDVAVTDEWLGAAGTEWPIKLRVGTPETSVFTGLSRQDAASLSMIAANERGAFEGLPAASSWEIELSARENQIVPGTLADCLVTFVLGGTYDPDFKDAVASRAANTLTKPIVRLLSARRMFPDAYYSLVRFGRMTLPVLDRHLSLSGTPRQLRNVAIVLPLTADGPEIGRSYCRYAIELDVQPGTNLKVKTPLPYLTFTPNGLTLRCEYAAQSGPVASVVTWDFGDRSAPVTDNNAVQHAYSRPGRYEVRARLVYDDRLVEYRAAIVISEQLVPAAPLVVAPTFTAGAATTDGKVPVTISIPAGLGISIDCATDVVRESSTSGSLQLMLPQGSRVMRFVASRSLSSHFYSTQRYTPTIPIVLERGRVATNRTFDLENETTTNPNTFTNHVFAGHVLSPVDRWTLELPLTANPWFGAVSSNDVEQIDCSELADALLALEFVESGTTD